LPGGTDTLILTISNPNETTTLSGIGFIDNLPSALTVAPVPILTNTCGGTAVAAALSSSVSLTGASLTAGSSCTVTVQVTAAVITPARICNSTAPITSTQSGTGFSATACITIGAVLIEPPDAYQLSYASNLLAGDSFVNLTNAGTLNGFDPDGRLCVNVYTFDPSEELIACCACLVTPDGLRSFSVKQDLTSNTLTPGVAGSVVIKLLATIPVAGTCNPSTPSNQNLAPGLRGWSATLHQGVSGRFEVAEDAFQSASLSPSELTKLTTYCGFIQVNGSNFGICKACRFGGLAGAQQ
jgi:hypothetical protein